MTVEAAELVKEFEARELARLDALAEWMDKRRIVQLTLPGGLSISMPTAGEPRNDTEPEKRELGEDDVVLPSDLYDAVR